MPGRYHLAIHISPFQGWNYDFLRGALPPRYSYYALSGLELRLTPFYEGLCHLAIHISPFQGWNYDLRLSQYKLLFTYPFLNTNYYFRGALPPRYSYIALSGLDLRLTPFYLCLFTYAFLNSNY